MKRFLTTFIAICFAAGAIAQPYQVDTLYKNGPLDNRINVVILGDGFTEAELPKFVQEAKKFADFFLGYDPYVRYRNYFNFFAIRTPSIESGVTNPGTAPDAYKDQPIGTKNTFFGASFGESIHRLVTVTKPAAFYNLMSSQFPMYDLVVVLVNTPFYGGSGGSIAVHTLHTQANMIGVHEIGHTFSRLNDEYWAGPGYGWEAANMTLEKNPSLVRWKNWLDALGIGIFQHGSSGDAALWHKPANGTCLMEYLNQSFCAVCAEATTETLLAQINPIENVQPAAGTVVNVNAPQKFQLDLLAPDPNTLQVKWTLNGEPVAGAGGTLTLTPGQVPDGAALVVSVFDSTRLSRYDGARNDRTRRVEWQLKSSTPNVFRVSASKDTICAGEAVTLTAYGCRGTLSWSAGGSGTSIQLNPAQTAVYSASCQVQGAALQTIEIPIHVYPLPNATAANGGPYTVGSTIELTASGGTTYLWTGPRSFASPLASVSIADATIANGGTYEVTVTDVNGCAKKAQTEVKVDPILAIPADPVQWVTISPNPAHEVIQVKTALSGKSTFTLFDQAGRKLVSKAFNFQTDIPVRFPAGLYVFRFTNGTWESGGKVVVE